MFRVHFDILVHQRKLDDDCVIKDLAYLSINTFGKIPEGPNKIIAKVNDEQTKRKELKQQQIHVWRCKWGLHFKLESNQKYKVSTEFFKCIVYPTMLSAMKSKLQMDSSYTKHIHLLIENFQLKKEIYLQSLPESHTKNWSNLHIVWFLYKLPGG